MSNRILDPWVGSLFGEQSNSLLGKRLLLLGESHYTQNVDAVGTAHAGETKLIVSKDAIDKPYRFFNALSRLVTGARHGDWSDEQRCEFWNSVAFDNFVPVFLAKGARPKVAQWRAGRELLQQVLALIQPEAIIVCGLDLWWYVMDALAGGEAAKPHRRDFAEVGSAKAVRIPHPTGSRGRNGYAYERARPLVAQMFAEQVQ